MKEKDRKVLFSTGNAEWRTPEDLFSRLDQEFHFTLDVASTKENALYEKYFTINEDGLTQSWKGEIVWCNPPYGRGVKYWTKKCYDETRNGCPLVVMLIPCRPDAIYFHDFIMNKASEVRFVRGRVNFKTPEGLSTTKAPFPSMIVIFENGKTDTKFSSFNLKQ